MDENHRRESLALREKLRQDLKVIERRILTYSPWDEDETFHFLVRKAVSYREWIKRLTDELGES